MHKFLLLTQLTCIIATTHTSLMISAEPDHSRMYSSQWALQRIEAYLKDGIVFHDVNGAKPESGGYFYRHNDFTAVQLIVYPNSNPFKVKNILVKHTIDINTKKITTTFMNDNPEPLIPSSTPAPLPLHMNALVEWAGGIKSQLRRIEIQNYWPIITSAVAINSHGDITYFTVQPGKNNI
jgi:hypothetical protein